MKHFWLLLLIAAGALALRVVQLDQRPLHNDEAVNATKLRDLWEKGQYHYDPNEYHGPTLYYATLPFVWLSSARDAGQLSDKTLRLAPVACGVALILLLWLMRDGLGLAATFWAALLTALSPAMVFYSRYFIHEMLLVCSTMVVMAAGWRYTRQPCIGWAILAGAGLGLMYATKETFVLAVGAMGLALVLTAAWQRRGGEVKAGPDNGPAQPDSLNAGLAKSPGPDCPVACCLRSWFGDWNRAHLLAFAAAAAGVALVLFTSFFTNWSGPLDSIRTYLPWLRRAGGHSPHIHPWYFYLERLAWFHPKKSPVWSEGLILALAGVGCLAAVLRWRMAGANLALARFLALFTVILTAIYAAIAYKTPWCLLGFWHGMILLAGLGAAVLFDWCRRWWARVLLMVILAVAVGHLGWQCWRANFKFAADRRNPYVYSQTVPDLLRLVQTVTGIAKVHPQGFGMPVIVAAPSHEYWPLPWYLRQFKQTGWWGQVPAGQSAPAMVISAAFQAELDEKSNKAWLMVGLFELRPQVFFECYVQFEWWKKYVDTLPKERE